jgi:hypothetical protein
MSIRRPLWLPLSIGALLSSLLLCGLVLAPLGPGLARWGSGAANQITQLISSTSTHSATPTTSTPYEFHDTLLRGNVLGWPADPAHCYFAADGYHVKGAICVAPFLAITNIELTVTVRFLAGQPENSVGVFFRMQDQNKDNLYAVSLTHSGAWLMGKRVEGEPTVLANNEHAEAMHAGLTAANTLHLVVRRDTFTLSLNTIVVGGVTDKSCASGFIALFAVPGAEAVFSDLSAILDQ